MLLSLALVLLLGYIASIIMKKFGLPSLIGMIIIGIIIGPFGLDLLSESLLTISQDLRTIALIIILTRAGLSLDFKGLKKNGLGAGLMCFVPATFEIIAIVILAKIFLNLSYLDGAIIGSILAAVSPAVVVPRMIKLIDQGYGRENKVPDIVLAGASVDDIFVIVLFTSFVSIANGGSLDIISLINIPISIVLGLIMGTLIGRLLQKTFDQFNTDITIKTIILLSISFAMYSFEKAITWQINFSSLIAIMFMGNAFRNSRTSKTELMVSYNNLWKVFEIILFVLVGASVDINYAWTIGPLGILVIVLALIVRMLGVFLSLLPTKLTSKEKFFTMGAYTPKATVQAAIGGLPLAYGLAVGNTALSLAVLAILVTAPFGAIFIDKTYMKLLDK